MVLSLLNGRSKTVAIFELLKCIITYLSKGRENDVPDTNKQYDAVLPRLVKLKRKYDCYEKCK